jgi:hypothetical protein
MAVSYPFLYHEFETLFQTTREGNFDKMTQPFCIQIINLSWYDKSPNSICLGTIKTTESFAEKVQKECRGNSSEKVDFVIQDPL